MMSRLRIGTRGSPLARYQAELVGSELQRHWPGLEIEYVYVRTEGDRRVAVPLDQIAGQGVFVKEIQSGLLRGDFDVAVHSMKDLPGITPTELAIAAVPPRADPRDALAAAVATLEDLPRASTLATSSPRRIAQLRAHRPDLAFVLVRGNVETRLRKVGEQGLAGAVLAAAGLVRLGLAERITQYIPIDVCLPQVGQGALAVEIRAADTTTQRLVEILDDPVARATTTAERAFLRRLGGGCQLPVGALALPVSSEGQDPLAPFMAAERPRPSPHLGPDSIVLRGFIGSRDGSQIWRGQLEGRAAEGAELGGRLADQLLADGAETLRRESQDGRAC
ncbi:MAG: hydroxymethylbilane synthase [Chloroflexi bacterium]|nr:hydroxymethylbilane synthase [Chloroflexota bacterium]